MRRPPRVLVPAVLAAALLLSGCSDEVEGSAAPATTSTTSESSSSSSAPTTGDEEYAEFCTEGEALFGEVDDAADAAEGMGSQAYVAVLQQAVDAFDSLEPPEEIADDWADSRDGFAELRDTVAAIDPSAPDAEQQARDVLDSGATTIGPAFERVNDWIDDNCP